jgi:hypothetical protein
MGITGSRHGIDRTIDVFMFSLALLLKLEVGFKGEGRLG